MGFLQSFLSLASAGVLLISGTLQTAAPHQDPYGNLFLVNRAARISANWVPAVEDAGVPGQVRNMRADAAAALREMFAACKEEVGVTLVSVSGYRSYASQQNIYHRKLKNVKGNVTKAEEYVAPPGASEHQLGLAMDIGQRNKTNLSSSFGETAGGVWARENCWRFGFILRYDAPWEDVTGYKYEPWHFRYVGKEYAKEIHDSGLPLELWLQGHRLSVLQSLLNTGEN